ncbi:unnamed protein product [Prunus armeniaca]
MRIPIFANFLQQYGKSSTSDVSDSGATDHMMNKKQYLCDFKNFTKAHSASVAYGTDVSVLGQGKDRITKKNIGEGVYSNGLYLLHHFPNNSRGLQGVLTVAYVINRLPSRVLNYKSPPEVLKGRKIDLSPLRIFGYVRFVHIQGLHRDKFDLRAAKCVFMGYSSTQKGYKCCDSRTRKIIISRDVVFDETCSFFDKSYGNNSKGESFLDQVPLPIVETIDDHSPTSVPCSRDITSSSEGTPSNNEGTPFDSVQTELISILPSLVAPRRNPSRARNPPPKFKDYNAFLHGELEEEVYMSLPPGHPQEKQEGMVCKLHKAIYELKQSPWAWYAKLSSVLESSNMREIHKLKSFLHKKFAIKDLGSLKYLLGIEIASSSKGLFLNQHKYVLDLLQETGMLETKPVITPINYKAKLGLDGDLLADASCYQRLVGRLIYLTITRPHISHAVSLVSQFMHSPQSTHLQAVKRILHYLKGSIGCGILMRKNGNNQIIGYSNVDWVGCQIDRKSNTGYCTFVGGNLVTWKSKKQSVVARSSAEAEYRDMKLFFQYQ